MEKENTSQKEEILKEAIDAINCLDKSNIKEMKSFSKPPPAVKLTMQCVAILFGVKPKKTDKNVEDYWEESRKLLNDPNFLDKLIKFNKDSISKKTIDKIAFVFDSHPEFSYEYVKKNSIAVANLFNWVSSILKYHQLISSKIIEEPVKEETKEMIDVEKVEKVEKEEKVEKTEKVEKGKEEERNLNLAESKKMNDEFEKPFLEASKSALNSINKTDLNELKNFNHPPTLVLKTMILVRMLLENNTNITDDWKSSQKLLTNPLKFLERLENIDISKISIKVIAEIVKQRESVPDFENKIRAVSKAAASLVIWVKGVCDYHKIKNQK